jgi:hypothetical protein
MGESSFSCTPSPCGTYGQIKLCIPGKELCGLSPNSYIHVSVSDLYIQHIWLQQNRQTDPKYINLSQIYESRNWETEHYNSVFGNNEAAQFPFWKYITRNQTFILDSHRLFICSAFGLVTTSLFLLYLSFDHFSEVAKS